MAVLTSSSKMKLAQHIRLLLEYVGEEYEEVLYESAPQWTAEKFNLDLKFPNLPYYKDGKVKLTQSNAILRYIARKHNLLGASPEQMAEVDMLLDTCMDYRIASAMVFYGPDFESKKDSLVIDTKQRMKQLNEAGQGRQWFAGDKITVADFAIYEYLKLMSAFEKTILDKFDWLKTFVANFEALEPVTKYMASPKFISYPFNGQMASWGGK